MYKCIKNFSIEICEGDENSIGNKCNVIQKETIWNTPEDIDHRTIGGEIRLENDDLGWIEIPKEYLEKYFKKGVF